MKAIGIDIGGTKISVAAIDESGSIRSQASFPTEPATGFGPAVERISNAVVELTEKAGWRLDELNGIGIGCTGPVDPKRGTVHNPYTLPTWDDCNIVQSLEDHFKIPVRLENDADSAALAEFRFGAGRDANPLVMLTFGTGIGFSAIVDGNFLRGVDGSHPELGHIPAVSDGPRCYCGIHGCFESMASGTAIEQAGRKIGLKTTREVFRAYKSEHRGARKIIDDALLAVEQAAWSIAHSFLPKRILLGGGMMEDHYDLFAQAMRKSLERTVLIKPNSIEIASTRLGNLAGVVGAASLVMQRLELQPNWMPKTVLFR